MYEAETYGPHDRLECDVPVKYTYQNETNGLSIQNFQEPVKIERLFLIKRRHSNTFLKDCCDAFDEIYHVALHLKMEKSIKQNI